MWRTPAGDWIPLKALSGLDENSEEHQYTNGPVTVQTICEAACHSYSWISNKTAEETKESIHAGFVSGIGDVDLNYLFYCPFETDCGFEFYLFSLPSKAVFIV